MLPAMFSEEKERILGFSIIHLGQAFVTNGFHLYCGLP